MTTAFPSVYIGNALFRVLVVFYIYTHNVSGGWLKGVHLIAVQSLAVHSWGGTGDGLLIGTALDPVARKGGGALMSAFVRCTTTEVAGVPLVFTIAAGHISLVGDSRREGRGALGAL